MVTTTVNVENDNVYCRFRQFTGRIWLGSYRPYYGRIVNERKRSDTLFPGRLQPGVIDLGPDDFFDYSSV